MANVLMVAACIPTPPNTAGSPRSFCFARELSSLHKVTLIVFATRESDGVLLDELEQSGVFAAIKVIPPVPTERPPLINRLQHLVRNAWFYTQKYLRPGYLAHVQNEIRTICREQAIDVIFADGLGVGQFIPDEFCSRTFMDLCDTHSSLYARMGKVATSLSRKFDLVRATAAVRYEEKQWIRKFPVTLVISEQEKAAIARSAPLERVRVICNGTDLDYFHPESTAPKPGMYIFMGVMSFVPNLDGVTHFIREIFPGIREQDPEALFYVVGKGPSADLLAENGKGGVVVTGEVDDVRPWLAQSEAFLCPLRIGAGVKNKLLVAMAMKLPIVCSRLSLEGLEAVPGTHLLVADTVEEYRSALELLRRSPDQRNKLVENAYELVTRNYSWLSKRDELDDVIRSVLGGTKAEQQPITVDG